MRVCECVHERARVRFKVSVLNVHTSERLILQTLDLVVPPPPQVDLPNQRRRGQPPEEDTSRITMH